MNIAVVGAGYAGASVAWHLQNLGAQVSLFDVRGIAGGASGVSTGLLHPYPAKKARFAERGAEAMTEATFLLSVAEEALGKCIALRTGIFRFAMSPEQEQEFLQREGFVKQKPLEGTAELPTFFIPEGITVFSRLYLEGLLVSFLKKGGQFLSEEIQDLRQLDAYDAIVLANGHEVLRFPECKELLLKIRKGQALICRGRIPCSMIGEGHISSLEDPELCQIGSTYEENFSLEKATLLQEKVSLFFPPARDFELLEIRSGIRIAQRNSSLPLSQQITPKVWVFTGLGSRGLLYHGLFGKELSDRIYHSANHRI